MTYTLIPLERKLITHCITFAGTRSLLIRKKAGICAFSVEFYQACQLLVFSFVIGQGFF